MHRACPQAREVAYGARHGANHGWRGGSDASYAVGEVYGVMAYPTNYLIGPDGTVLWRGLGFNEDAIRQALANAGVQ